MYQELVAESGNSIVMDGESLALVEMMAVLAYISARNQPFWLNQTESWHI